MYSVIRAENYVMEDAVGLLKNSSTKIFNGFYIILRFSRNSYGNTII